MDIFGSFLLFFYIFIIILGSLNNGVLNPISGPHSYMGITKKTDQQIANFNASYLIRHPYYNVATDNCQTYVTEFFDFLMEDGVRDGDWLVGNRLPWKESFLS